MNFDEISHFCMKHEKLLSYAQIFFFFPIFKLNWPILQITTNHYIFICMRTI